MSDSQAPAPVLGAESGVEQLLRDANRAIYFASDGRPAAGPAHWQPGAEPELCRIQALSCLVNANVCGAPLELRLEAR